MSHGFAHPQEALDVEERSNEMKAIFTDAVGRLPERQQLILALYYREDLRLREIGEVMGISESRVSQLHGKALVSLRAAIGVPAPSARFQVTH
jgi:RNA polymerase sigma factor for flagellar operon FliA